MIQKKSVLLVADNSGAKKVQCIQVPKNSKRNQAKVGDVLTASVKQLRNRARHLSKVNKGNICKVILVRTKTPVTHKDGFSTSFDSNCCVLLNSSGAAIGSRLVGPLPRASLTKTPLNLPLVGSALI